MTEELFDLLRRKGLKDNESAERLILRSYTLGQLVQLDRELAKAVETAAEDVSESQHDVAGFDFWPNSDLTASVGGCQEANCRPRRTERLSRFATMWADSAYIPSYFGILREHESEEFWRKWLLGSVRCILGTEPALKAGIIRLALPYFRLCPTCYPTIAADASEVRRLLIQAEQSVRNSYGDRIEVTFRSHGKRSYVLAVSGPEDLIPHGWVGFVTDPATDAPPQWLPKTVRDRAASGRQVDYQLPKRRLQASGAVDKVIHPITEDVVNQHLACKLQQTKYLTHRPADVQFLTAINDNDNFAAWNAVLAQYLSYEMPILDGVPLQDLIDLRTHDYEAFAVYRDTMKGIIADHIANRPAITGTEARDLYSDKVLPQLNKMNQKLRAARDKLSNKLRRDVRVAGGVITLGLTSGLIAPPLALSAGLAAPLAIDAAKTALQRRDASDELKSDNFYFLWKVAQKSRQN